MNHNDNKILSHSTWNCKYHIVFAPKYRRKIFYESHRKEIMEIIKELCRWKEVEILEGEMAVDHVHLLLIKSYCHCDSFLNVLHSFCVQLAGRTSIIYEWSYFFNTTSA